MAQVTVTVNGRNYTIACDDGQEAHLVRLGQYLDNRGRELTAAVGHVSNDMLLVMTGLLVADELSDAYGELEALKGKGSTARSRSEAAVAGRIDTLADRIETLAERMASP